MNAPVIVNPRAEAVRWLRELADDIERGGRLIERVDVERHTRELSAGGQPRGSFANKLVSATADRERGKLPET